MKKEKTKKSGARGFVIIAIVLGVILIFFIVRVVLKPNQGAAAEAENAGDGPPGTRQPAGEDQIFAINTTPVVVGPIVDYYDLNGEVVTKSSVETYADAGGVLSKLLVTTGDFVTRNQIIAQVDPSRPGLNYSLSPVRARVAGTITAVFLDPGDVVTAQTVIARIGDLNRLEVEVAVPERFISRVRVGMDAQLRLEAWPGQIFSAQVNRVSPVVDPTTHSVDIVIDVPSGNEDRIKAGMYVKIRLVTDRKDNAFKLPADTVLRRSGEVYVFVVKDDTAEKRGVVTGVILDDVVEIVDGVETGENVVYQGQTLLEDGSKIRVVRSVEVIDQ